MEHASLPPGSGHVEVHLLNGGSFIAETGKINAGCQNERFRLYNWAFAIYHKKFDRKVIWDLGIVDVRPLEKLGVLKLMRPQEPTSYSPFIRDVVFNDISPASPKQSIEEQVLTMCDWKATDVDTVIFR